MDAVILQKTWTYGDYAALNDDKRYEIIEGDITMMAAPGHDHQSVSGEMLRQITNHLDERPCRVFHAPFDVILLKKDELRAIDAKNAVQPDLIIVCDENKIKNIGCVGTPDIVVEILSPTSAMRDMITKRSLYERFGVQQYWIVSTEERCVTVLSLENGRFGEPLIVKEGEILASEILPGLAIDLKKVFSKVG